jgi:hypothetical protein
MWLRISPLFSNRRPPIRSNINAFIDRFSDNSEFKVLDV